MKGFSNLRSESLDKERSFMWVAQYNDDTYIKEFGCEKKVRFKEIDKNRLKNFGIVGLGNKLYYDTEAGVFYINGIRITFLYRTEEWEYNLTNQETRYDDVIQYKKCFTDLNPGIRKVIDEGIESYNFGYKTQFNCKGVVFNFKAICAVPAEGREPYINIRLVSDKSLDGELIIKVDEKIIDRYDAPLEKNKGGEINWFIRK